MDYEVKADAIDAAFDTMEVPPVVANRPALSGARTADPARAAFIDGYVRRGTDVELKSFTGTTGPDGGFAIPREIDGNIDALLKAASPIRQIANVVRVGSAGYRKLVTQNGVSSGWASETQARPETGTPTFNEVIPSFGDLYANPAATQVMLDDAAFDVEGWLASEISAEFAKAEGTAFVSGSGTNRPRGFLTGTPVLTGDATRAFGVLQYVPTGAAGALPPGGGVGDELGNTRRHPQVQDDRWRLPLPARPGRGPAQYAARLSGGGSRRHARHCGQQPLDRVRQFQGGLSDRRAGRDDGAA